MKNKIISSSQTLILHFLNSIISHAIFFLCVRFMCVCVRILCAVTCIRVVYGKKRKAKRILKKKIKTNSNYANTKVKILSVLLWENEKIFSSRRHHFIRFYFSFYSVHCSCLLSSHISKCKVQLNVHKQLNNKQYNKKNVKIRLPLPYLRKAKTVPYVSCDKNQ